MGGRIIPWLIGAKIVCCGALILVLTGALSLGTITAVLTGNALPIAGGAVVVLVAAAALLRQRSSLAPPDGDDLGEELQTDRRSPDAPDV
jgi:hypothetical protein